MFLHLTCRACMHIVLNFTSEKNNYISVKHYKYYHNYTKKKADYCQDDKHPLQSEYYTGCQYAVFCWRSVGFFVVQKDKLSAQNSKNAMFFQQK